MAGPGTSKDTPWSFVIKLPRKAQVELKRHGLDTGRELQDIGLEMVREWAERHGVKVTTEEPAEQEDSEPESRARVA